MNKRLVCFILVVCFAVTLFSGCGQSVDTGKASGSGAAVTTAKADGTAAADTSAAATDYGTVKILINQSYSKGTDIEKVAEFIKEKCGVKIEPIYADGTADKFILMLAAGEEIDMTRTDLSTYNTYVKGKTLYPLSALVDQLAPNAKKRIEQRWWDWLKDDNGEIYGIPNTSINVGSAVMIRKDLMDSKGLTMPTTIDEFKEVLTKFKSDFKSPPLIVDCTANFFFDQVLGGAFLKDGYSWWKNTDGTYLPPEMSPDYKTFISTMADWYKQGLLHPESFGSKWQPTIETGKIAAWVGWNSYPFYAQMNMVKKDPAVNFTMLQPLAGAYDNGYQDKKMPNTITVISAKSKNPEGVLRLINYQLDNLENWNYFTYGIPGEEWNWVDKEAGTVEKVAGGDAKFVYPSFDLVGVCGFFTRADKKAVPEDWWWWDYIDNVIAGNVRKTYEPIDYKYTISDSSLKSASKLTDLTTAMVEGKIKFISGARPMSEWDAFISELKAMGWEDMIKEKNEIFAAKVK